MDDKSSIITRGYPSIEEIKTFNSWPTDERFNKGPVAIIECVQEIPCNPCENACKFKAITIGSPITNCPSLDFSKCTGCSMCVAACSGLAIFIINKAYSETEATVSFPFEYLPLPKVNDEVLAVNRAGEFVCMGKVVKIMNPKINDNTVVVTIAIPKVYADTVRSIKRLNSKAVEVSTDAVENNEIIPDDILVCRCEEITAGEIRKAIKEGMADSITGVKRRVRAGMGLCQGRTCGKLVSRIISEEIGKNMSLLVPSTDRAPVRPISFGELGGCDNE